MANMKQNKSEALDLDQLAIELESLREMKKMLNPKKEANALKCCIERIALIEQKLKPKDINKEQIAEVIQYDE